MTYPTDELGGRAELVCLGSFSLGICQPMEKMSYDQLLPSIKGLFVGLQCAACGRVSKSAQFRGGMLLGSSASKLHPLVQLFFSSYADVFTPCICLPCPFSVGFKFKWGRWVVFIDLLKLHLSFGFLVLLSGRFL